MYGRAFYFVKLSALAAVIIFIVKTEIKATGGNNFKCSIEVEFRENVRPRILA